MNLFSHFEEKVRAALLSIDIANKLPVDLSRVAIEPPRDPAHGDLATNAAMVSAKHAGMTPRALAEQIAAELLKDPDITSAEIAGPGFINLRLTDKCWTDHLRHIVTAGGDYGKGVVGQGRMINVEYVSANPTGPLHVGHSRGAVVGDALANLLAFAGFDVTREYYFNDAGTQIEVLTRSVFLRYREALGEDIGTIPEGLYPGGYLIPVAQALARDHGEALIAMAEPQWMDIVRETAVAAMMGSIRNDLALINVRHDVFFCERFLHAHADDGKSKIDNMLVRMREAGHVYTGRLPPPKGKPPEDWEDREQTLFRSTEVGDDVDRPLVKSNGAYTYFAADVAYFQDKFERGYQRMVFVLGADHGGYVKRLKAVANALAGDPDVLDVLLCQLVRLFRGGEPVKMSKRAGEFVTVADLVEEVGSDAIRFMMLYRRPEAPLDFDFEKVTEQSRDNPVFYVQYAHARCKSVFRQAKEELGEVEIGPDGLADIDLELLADSGELALIRKLAEFPRMIQQAAVQDEPHRVAFYLYELASELHVQWSRGKELPKLRFVNPNRRNLTAARLALLFAVSSVLASGLAIVGASAPDEMR